MFKKENILTITFSILFLVGGTVFLVDPPFAILEPTLANLPVFFSYLANGNTAVSSLGGVEGMQLNYDVEKWY